MFNGFKQGFKYGGKAYKGQRSQFKNWSRINHAKIAAKTPSNEKTIAAGAGDIFCKLYVCNKKARPLDKIPTYKTSYESFKKLLNVGSSK